MDGESGTVCAKPGKVAKYVALTLQMLYTGSATQRDLRATGGWRRASVHCDVPTPPSMWSEPAMAVHSGFGR